MPVLIPGIADSLHVRLFAAGSLVLAKWWTDTDNIRSMWRLCRANRSGAVLLYGDARFPLPAERLVLVPPGLKFKAHLDRPVKELFVHFEVVGWPVPAVRDIFPEPCTLAPDPLRDQIAEELRKEIESALATQSQIDRVYAHNDPRANGAYLAAKQAGPEKSMKFV